MINSPFFGEGGVERRIWGVSDAKSERGGDGGIAEITDVYLMVYNNLRPWVLLY